MQFRKLRQIKVGRKVGTMGVWEFNHESQILKILNATIIPLKKLLLFFKGEDSFMIFL